MRQLRLAVSRQERRRSLRISAPFTALVRGITEHGQRVEFRTEIDNLSTGGLFLKTNRDLRGWKRITLLMRLSLDQNSDRPAPAIVAKAKVLRAEIAPADCAGYALALQARRFV